MFHVEQSINNKSCPICLSNGFSHFLTCKDFTVSKDDFAIVACNACGFALTNPRPADNLLGAYYESNEYISHSNTKTGLVSQIYQAVRKRTLRHKLNLINREGRRGALLDVGCGTGEFLATCKQDGWQTTGIEPSANARQQAIQNHKLDVREEHELGNLPPQSFDVITLWHVLEHVPYLQERVKKLQQLLKKDGLLVIAVPNRMSHDAEYYGAFWAAYDVPRHLWHFRPQDMRRLMDECGFKVEKVLPMKFDSYYVSLLSEKYRAGRPRLLAAFIRGWISNRKAGTEAWSSQIYIIRQKR
jgi:2-polyprenyl-3-methyl-5-hydroxy-6-metoxy-1,4-benzoquinol methylase